MGGTTTAELVEVPPGQRSRPTSSSSVHFLLPQLDPKFTGALVQGFLILGFMLMGATFGPMGALLPELFPTNVRYTGSAISYNVSSILGAALAPIVATALWAAAGGSPWLVGVYLTGSAVLTFIALWLSKETKDVEYETNIGHAELRTR